MKSDALYDAGHPIKVRSGGISKLEVKVPWKKIWSHPTTIVIEGLYLEAGDLAQAEVDSIVMGKWRRGRHRNSLATAKRMHEQVPKLENATAQTTET